MQTFDIHHGLRVRVIQDTAGHNYQIGRILTIKERIASQIPDTLPSSWNVVEDIYYVHNDDIEPENEISHKKLESKYKNHLKDETLSRDASYRKLFNNTLRFFPPAHDVEQLYVSVERGKPTVTYLSPERQLYEVKKLSSLIRDMNKDYSLNFYDDGNCFCKSCKERWAIYQYILYPKSALKRMRLFFPDFEETDKYRILPKSIKAKRMVLSILNTSNVVDKLTPNVMAFNFISYERPACRKED